MDLDQLREKWPTWGIRQTQGGAWVARRKRYFVLTENRIDQGFRDCLIEESAKKLDNQIDRKSVV